MKKSTISYHVPKIIASTLNVNYVPIPVSIKTEKFITYDENGTKT